MYIGIDLGTSSVKVVLIDIDGKIVISKAEKLTIQRRNHLWSEQDPTEWWDATCRAMMSLKSEYSLSRVIGIGLAGQMHGAVLLDKRHRLLRPAILWNDGRCGNECSQLAEAVPFYKSIIGNLIMPGFTAPKIMWLKKHEPDIFCRIDKIILPKDYLRLKLTGDIATDMSDASGTAWLDIKSRDWSDQMLEACQLTRKNVPCLFESCQVTGTLLPSIARTWQIKTRVSVAAGAGDNAAGAIGAGMFNEGQSMLSLGTSGVYFSVSDVFLSNPENAVHSFCHAIPNKWHLMSVMLSAASCLEWMAKISGLPSPENVIAQAKKSTNKHDNSIWFLPYLSGERTPHNNPYAKGAFFGLTHQHKTPELCLAVLEGVNYGLADGIDVVHSCKKNSTIKNIMLVGGGARSAYWCQMLSNISGHTLIYNEGFDVGPALGAAILAAIATGNPDFRILPNDLKSEKIYVPDCLIHDLYKEKRVTFRKIYQNLAELMS